MSAASSNTRAAAKAEWRSAVRVHTALTADAEKRVLIWMARRVPKAVNSDHLTALAFLAQIAAGAAYAAAGHDRRALLVVDVLLFLNWLGDSLDGTLARVRNQQRPRYGFYVDHIVDTFGAFALMAGMACSGYLHWQIAIGMLLCFYVLSIESYLATYTMGSFQLSHGPFGPTEIRILLAAGNLAVLVRPFGHLAARSFLLFDAGGATAIAGMLTMALAATIRHVRTLYKEETL